MVNKEVEVAANKERKGWDVVEAVRIWESLEKIPYANLPSESDGKFRRQRAAKLTGYGHDTLSKAKYVLTKATPEEIKAMRIKGSVDSYYRKYKLEEQKKEIEQLKKVKGNYDIIVIDPPWSFKQTYDDKGNRGLTDYPTMELNELNELKLPTKNNCVIWLWVTNQRFREAFSLLEQWGFEPKIILTWNKVNMGVGRYLRNITEHCILAFKGKPYFKNTTWTTLITEARTTHSTKPETFYKMVEDCCAGRKLDYFARKERKGWDVYGDKVK